MIWIQMYKQIYKNQIKRFKLGCGCINADLIFVLQIKKIDQKGLEEIKIIYNSCSDPPPQTKIK